MDFLRTGNHMSEYKTIEIPRGTPLSQRLLEAKEQLSKWLEAREKQFDVEADRLSLSGYEKTEDAYVYHYELSPRQPGSGVKEASAAK
jgi:hypothetical protein